MINWADTRRVTVIMPTWIGDVCMATPALRALRESMPEDGHITAAVRHGMKPLLRAHPCVDDLVTIDPRGVLGPWKAGRQLAHTTPEALLVLPGSFRSALAARFAGSSARVGYAKDGRGWLLNAGVRPPDRSRPVATTRWYLNLVDPDATAAPVPELTVTSDDESALAMAVPSLPPACALMIPGANRADKRWPANRFAAVANALFSRYGWTTVIAGAAGERELTATVAAACTGPVIDLAKAQGSLGALKAIVKQAEVVVSNDTGPRHLALGLGTPVVTLFGPTDHRWTTVDSAHETRLLAEPFLPDALVADRCAAACQIDRISVGDVLHAIDQMGATPRSDLH